MKLISWNTGGRRLRLEDQVRAVLRQEPDIVCLQEVRTTTVDRWRTALAESGLSEVAESSGRTTRKLFNLTAARWPLIESEPPALPQPERLLSVLTESDHGPIQVHNLHVPPVRDLAQTRLETLTAVHAFLAREHQGHRLLCGDLNTSRAEIEEPDPNSQGAIARAETELLQGLAEWDLRDVYRELHGYGHGVVSRSGPGHHRQKGHRLDHVLASRSMNPVFCEYQDGWRREGYSDHSAMEVIFDPS